MVRIPFFVRRLALLLPLACGAQQFQRTFSANLAATGPSAAAFVDAQNHTLQANVVSPATCTLRLEGSLDGVRWSDLSGSQPCTSNTMFHVDGKSVVYARVYLITYSGDQAGAKVAVYYKGVN
jgi:hypothetical protein